jgi:hypothetical protein
MEDADGEERELLFRRMQLNEPETRKSRSPSQPLLFQTQRSSNIHCQLSFSHGKEEPAQTSSPVIFFFPLCTSLTSFVPTAPEEDLKPVVSYYWTLGMNDKEIACQTLDHFNKAEYGLRCACRNVFFHNYPEFLSSTLSSASVKRLRKRFNLLSTRQQHQTFLTIAPFVTEVRERFPTMGARQMVVTL